MLFIPTDLAKQDQLQTLTRAASASPTEGDGSSRRRFFFAMTDSSESNKSSTTKELDGSTSSVTSTPEQKTLTELPSAYAVVHQGVLSRLTSWGQWKERYFVMDRVGIYWYRSPEAMNTAREQLLGGQAATSFALKQLGLQVAWGVSLRLFRDRGSKNQMSLNSPTKIMKLRAPSAEALDAWLSAFDQLRQTLTSEFKAAPELQRELVRSHSQANIHHRRAPRSNSTSHYLGQSMMVAGNSAIVRSRASSAVSPKTHAKTTFGATFVIGGDADSSNSTHPTNTRESEAIESVHGTGSCLLESRPDSSISANYQTLDTEA
jgi:hypothetical protein